jgi:hypothetical protein
MKTQMKRRSPTRQTPASPDRPRAVRRKRADRELAQHLLAILKSGGDARRTKIKQLRQKVRASAYENDLKLSVAIDKMIGAGMMADGQST